MPRASQRKHRDHKSDRHRQANPRRRQAGQHGIFDRRIGPPIQNSSQQSQAIRQRIGANNPADPVISRRRKCAGQQPHRQQKYHHDRMKSLRRLHWPRNRQPQRRQRDPDHKQQHQHGRNSEYRQRHIQRETQQHEYRGMRQCNQRPAQHFSDHHRPPRYRRHQHRLQKSFPSVFNNRYRRKNSREQNNHHQRSREKILRIRNARRGRSANRALRRRCGAIWERARRLPRGPRPHLKRGSQQPAQ